MSLIQTLKKYKAKSHDLNYGRDILRAWANEFIKKNQSHPIRILDIGCGWGGDLVNIQTALTNKGIITEIYGVDMSHEYVEAAKAKGIYTSVLEIEHEKPPFTEKFDLIIINQVLEHTKEIFWIIKQANEHLKDNGLLFVGVPNLAALHNRLLLLFGQQPACIRIFSAHFRGFTKKEFIKFMENYGGFKALRFAGSNFYPFPRSISKLLSKLLPTLATTIFFAFRKIGPDQFVKAKEAKFETKYLLD